ncbi:MAG TPA: hypothetical protein VGM11_03685 [Acidobacteriaceae bacterium]|jgi:hypothetical protein
MNQTVTDPPLTTADIANSPRPLQISNATSEPARDPQFPDLRPESAAQPGGADSSANADGHGPLFPQGELQDLRSRWDRTQSMFVDEPRKAVEEADTLVASTVKRLAELFADERAKLEEQWSRGGDASTEDLRQALRRYRAFFDRLLTLQ